MPRPTTDRPQAQEPLGSGSQQFTRLPPMRPDFQLDAAQHAAAHSAEPGSPPAAAPTTAAGGRQQAQVEVTPQPSKQQQQPPVLPPPPGHRRDRVCIVGQVPSAVNAAALVPLPPGPAHASLAEGIDSFTQMMWDRRLGGSSGRAQTKVAEGDYVQEAPVLRP